jgi:hypothetical protein
MFRSIFKFLASLKLALVLLSVIIVAVAYGTWLESKFSAEAARRIVYGHFWFDIWLTFLAINLFCVAAIRYPWKPHQTGFVITHAGIIILLFGSIIDRHYGVEGFVQLHRGEPSTDMMELREQELVVSVDGVPELAHTKFNVKSMDAKFPVKSPSPEVKVDVIDTKEVEAYKDFTRTAEGRTAVHVRLQGPMMGRQEHWMFVGDHENLGPATVGFENGMPPPVTPKADATAPEKVEMKPRQERYYVFSKQTENTMLALRVGDPTNATVTLHVDEQTTVPTLRLKLFDKDFAVPIQNNVKKDYALEGLDGWKIYIYGYFPHFSFNIAEKKPFSVDDKPENPAIIFDLLGPLVKAKAESLASVHGGGQLAPGMGDGSGAASSLQLFLGEDGNLRYFIKSRREGEFSGDVAMGKTLDLHWAPGTQFTVDELYPHAASNLAWRPVAEVLKDNENQTPGLLCKITAGGQSKEVWLGQRLLKMHPDPKTGNTVVELPRETFDVGGKKVSLSFANQHQMLPFKVALLKFSAPRDEGLEESMSFASFESTLTFDDHLDWVQLKPDAKLLQQARNPGKDDQDMAEILAGGQTRDLFGAITADDPTQVTLELANRQVLTVPKSDVAAYVHKTHKIYMNSPTTYPITWYGPWLGTTYKFSQAEHRMPVDPDYSGVQVLRDPGWMPKWVGCLMICFGIFTMFYLKPYFHRRPEAAAAAPVVADSKQSKKKDNRTIADAIHAKN